MTTTSIASAGAAARAAREAAQKLQVEVQALNTQLDRFEVDRRKLVTERDDLMEALVRFWLARLQEDRAQACAALGSNELRRQLESVEAALEKAEQKLADVDHERADKRRRLFEYDQETDNRRDLYQAEAATRRALLNVDGFAELYERYQINQYQPELPKPRWYVWWFMTLFYLWRRSWEKRAKTYYDHVTSVTAAAQKVLPSIPLDAPLAAYFDVLDGVSRRRDAFEARLRDRTTVHGALQAAETRYTSALSVREAAKRECYQMPRHALEIFFRYDAVKMLTATYIARWPEEVQALARLYATSCQLVTTIGRPISELTDRRQRLQKAANDLVARAKEWERQPKKQLRRDMGPFIAERARLAANSAASRRRVDAFRQQVVTHANALFAHEDIPDALVDLTVRAVDAFGGPQAVFDEAAAGAHLAAEAVSGVVDIAQNTYQAAVDLTEQGIGALDRAWDDLRVGSPFADTREVGADGVVAHVESLADDSENARYFSIDELDRLDGSGDRDDDSSGGGYASESSSRASDPPPVPDTDTGGGYDAGSGDDGGGSGDSGGGDD